MENIYIAEVRVRNLRIFVQTALTGIEQAMLKLPLSRAWKFRMPIYMKDCGARGNKGDGMLVVGDANLTLNNFQSNNNGGQGFNIITVDALIAQLGLPKETDRHLIKEVFDQLLADKTLSPERAIRNSGLFGKISAAGADLSTIAANFSSILTNPNLQLFLGLLN